MEKGSVNLICLFNLACVISLASPVYAGKEMAEPPADGSSPFSELPVEMISEIASHLEDLRSLDNTSRVCRSVARSIDQSRRKQKVVRIESIMNKFGEFIPLPKDGSISPVAPTQELWVEVMRNNPSFFKEKKYCPDTYREVVKNGKRIGMCPDFPMDTIIPVSEGKKDSDVEFIAQMNLIYQNAGLDVSFRRATGDEYRWAESEGGNNPKSAEDRDLWKFFPYGEISDRDPRDLLKPSPSGEHQPRSMVDNAPNGFGFRRSGVWEWVEDMLSPDSKYRNFVGGSWSKGYPGYSASGDPESGKPVRRSSMIGPARLVKMKEGNSLP